MKRPNNKPNLKGFAESGLSRMQPAAKEQTRTYLSGNVQAKRRVIPASDVETKTGIHPLNPRNQEALTKEAVRDILPSIKENGVNVEGVAIRCSETGKLLLLDASRRRFSCILAGIDLPVWELQGDVTDEQILAIINDSQEVKRWSYPEHANYLLTVALRKGLNAESMKIEDLAKALSIGRESLRKRLEAANVSLELREVFPDYEGIPNSFYSRLAKVERNLLKAGKSVTDFIKHIQKVANADDFNGDVFDVQVAMMTTIETNVVEFIGKEKVKREWTTKPLASFADKNAYARISHSPDKKKMKLEFSRIGLEKMKKIESYIELVLNED